MSGLGDWNATAALVRGITLLEASAGTGKTYNITSLVLRLVAEHDVEMGQMVVVTFTRAATAELRDRIRTRLVGAVDALGRSTPPQGDEVLELLWDAGEDERARRGRRLRAAQEAFDECLISTIHGFCQRMLQQNAFESQADFDLELVEDTTDLVAELVDDWLSLKLHPSDPEGYAFRVEQCGFSRAALLELAQLALRDPDMTLLPDSDEVKREDWERERAEFAGAWTDGGNEAVADMYEAAHQTKAVFAKPGQRTYVRKECLKRGRALGDWLASGPGWLDEAPNADYWSSKNVRKQLAGGQQEPLCDELLALRRLLAFGARVAACEQSRFVVWLRREFDRRAQQRRVQSYQDLMRSLARVLGRNEDDPARKSLVQAIGGRFRVALIDEFQDTDALQWTIFRSVFADATHYLYLIGDPKQAIYLFRGANVHVYLEAQSQAAGRTFTMPTSYRADARLVDAFNWLMKRPGYFGEAGIDYVEVGARERDPVDRANPQRPWSDPYAAPLQIRFIDQRLTGASQVSDADQPVSKGAALALLPGRVAADVVELLEAGVTLRDVDHPDAGQDGFRRLGPGDIAVLTRTGYQARDVHAALGAVGVPAVLMGADSVLASDEAREIQFWLEALASAGRDRPARKAATTRLFGRDATLLARVDAEDPEAIHSWDAWLAHLAAWRKRYQEAGFLRTLRRALDDDLCPPWDAPGGEPLDATTRLLRRSDGDRRLTNVWHVAELLHEAETRERLHLPGLLAWLVRQRAKTTVDSESVELRLERDDEAVRILSMHKSKGLEFPVVFAPYLWDGKGPKEGDTALVVPSESRAAERVLDLREGSERAAAFQRAWLESKKEEIRLFYVALTRARYRAVLYAGHINELENSPLAPTLHGELRGAKMDRIGAGASFCRTATRSQLLGDLEKISEGSSSSLPDRARTIAVSVCDRPWLRKWRAPDPAAEKLVARSFSRLGLDLSWKRHSYTSLAHGKEVSYAPVPIDREGFDPDPEEHAEAVATPVGEDEWAPEYRLPAEVESVPLAAFPPGADAGTFLHEVFEKADFAWAHESAGEEGGLALQRLLAELMVRHDFDQGQWLDLLQSGLVDVLRTPLGATLGALRLCDVPKSVRLDELRFDYPIAGGSDARGTGVGFDAIAHAIGLRKDVLGPEDEMTVRGAYLRGLRDEGQLAGFLTGSIDLVFCHPVGDRARWFIVDYKSNRLDPRRERRYPIQHFCREGLRYAMEQHHYYLQYHLYLLALHRYLSWRLGEAYDYERDVGGVYYLFFRGLVGEQTPTEGAFRHGAFFDRPPLVVVEALDRLFRAPLQFEGGVA